MSSNLNAVAPIHKNRSTTLGRINNFTSKDSLFKKTNLSSQLYPEVRSITDIEFWSLPGGSGAWQNYTFDQISQQEYTSTELGQTFGPTWTTHWFRFAVPIPPEWEGREVHFRWYSGSEATLWSTTGAVLQGLSPGFREEFILSRSYVPGEPVTYYVEMACNAMFGAGAGGDGSIEPPIEDKYYKLERVEIGIFDRAMFKLYTDLEILYQMADRLGDNHIGYQAMFAANEMVNKITFGHNEEAGEIADAFFAEGNGVKSHRLMSIGHCHIDTAWLWPYNETIRKCARSWTAQMRLLDEFNDAYFACSQAAQYAWMKEFYPGLFEELKVAVAAGRFVPVGGAWVEMDGNIPSGEAFIRQFFYGQRFFQEEFGITCKEFWLPDTFGYSAQIPQIIKHVGIHRFMTQKMSWNQVNKMPNHSFMWEGIDGSEVLVHFPPGNTYNANATVEEILFSQSNSEDKGRANVGMYLYGYGDGGGGPTRTMIERQRRLHNVDGIPRVEFNSPEIFWETLELEQKKFYRWVGELFLELHNGTYTSQAKIKWYNRKSEFLFNEMEFLMAGAYALGKVTESVLRTDIAVVDKCWKDCLLNQFHDVLPGSCIELIVQDAWKLYEDLFTIIMALRETYQGYVLGTGESQVCYNPLTWNLLTVIFNHPDTGTGIPDGPNVQSVTMESTPFEESVEGRYRIPSEFKAALVQLNGSGHTVLTPLAPASPVVYNNGVFQIGQLSLEISESGLPYEKLLFTKLNGEQEPVFNDYANTDTQAGMIYIYDDVPLFWDAWDIADYHMETKGLPNFSDFDNVQVFAQGPIVGGYKWSATFGNGSRLTRYTILKADSPMIEYFLTVDWKEQHKLLRVEFPVNVLSREATFEIQYGHIKRNNHTNTSWDWAKYEVCGHKWVDISQADKGVTLITDSKYGFCVRGNVVKLSLLKAPKNPDANCDIHKHYIHYAVLPHEGGFQEAEVIRRAYELNYFGANNVPVLSGASINVTNNWVTVDHPAVIVGAVKPAHDIPDAVVVRLYESHGGSAKTRIHFQFPVSKVQKCNGLEAELGPELPLNENSFETDFGPFKLSSFLVTLAR